MRRPESFSSLGQRIAGWPWPLLLVVTAAAVIRIANFAGCTGGSDLGHSWAGYQLLGGDFDLRQTIQNPVTAMRLGMALPVSACFALFGINEVSSVLYPLLASLGTVLLAYAIGRRAGGSEAAGLAAAGLMAIAPIEITYSTILLPDVPLAFFQALTIYVFLKADDDSRTRHAGLLFLAAGITLGYAFLVKETALLRVGSVLALFAGIRIVENGWKQQYLLVGAGFVLVLAAETLFYLAATGEWFPRYTIMASAVEGGRDVAIRRGLDLSFLVRAKMWAAHLLLRERVTLVWCAAGVSLAALALARKRHDEATLFALWFGIGFIVFLVSLSQTFAIHSRRLVVLYLPVALLLAALMKGSGILKARRAAGLIAAVTLFAAILFGFSYDKLSRRYKLASVRQAFAFLKEDRWSRPVYTDLRTSKAWFFLNGFVLPRGLRVVPEGAYLQPSQEPVRVSEISDGYVFVNRTQLRSLIQNVGVFDNLTGSPELQRLIEYDLDPPPHWRRLERLASKDAALYAVSGPGDAD